MRLHHVFEVPDDQAAVFSAALDVGSFPWAKLQPGIRRDVGRDYIPTKLSDLSRFSMRVAGDHSHDHDHDVLHVLEVRNRVLGLFWTDYRIEIEQSLVDEPTLLAEVLWSEGAHAIDYAMLTDAQRQEIVAVLHPEGPDEHTWWEVADYAGEYHRLIGETMMELVVEAYSSLTATINLHHHVTPAAIQTVRRILTPEPVKPEPPPFPDGSGTGAGFAPFFGADGSEVVHDSHRGVLREREWRTLAAAKADGRRACRVCKPKEAA